MLVVGDSLEVGTEPYLRQELGGTELDVDAKTSRPSSDGVAVLQGALGPSTRWSCSTSAPTTTRPIPTGSRRTCGAAAEIAGDRCLVFATINRPPLAGVSDAGLNQAVDEVATATGAQIADWRSAASEPGMLQADGVHATASGYARRGAARRRRDPILRFRRLAGRAAARGTLKTLPPKPVKAPPAPELGPGLALLAVPVLAVAERAAAILGFARGALAGLRHALDPALALGGRVLRRIGSDPADQP